MLHFRAEIVNLACCQALQCRSWATVQVNRYAQTQCRVNMLKCIASSLTVKARLVMNWAGCCGVLLKVPDLLSLNHD